MLLESLETLHILRNRLAEVYTMCQIVHPLELPQWLYLIMEPPGPIFQERKLAEAHLSQQHPTFTLFQPQERSNLDQKPQELAEGRSNHSNASTFQPAHFLNRPMALSTTPNVRHATNNIHGVLVSSKPLGWNIAACVVLRITDTRVLVRISNPRRKFEKCFWHSRAHLKTKNWSIWQQSICEASKARLCSRRSEIEKRQHFHKAVLHNHSQSWADLSIIQTSNFSHILHDRVSRMADSKAPIHPSLHNTVYHQHTQALCRESLATWGIAIKGHRRRHREIHKGDLEIRQWMIARSRVL